MSNKNQLNLSEREGWLQVLNGLPSRDQNDESKPIPSLYFAHGHPGILFPMGRSDILPKIHSPNGKNTLNRFLKDLGPVLLEKFKPKAILVFSAHWETDRSIKVTDYGEDQPLLYDYYGFPENLYKLKWHSNGSKELTDRIISKLEKAGIKSERTLRSEPRGEDGLIGPAPGLDHGVFIPFILMFPEAIEKTFDIPVVEVSIAGSLDPTDEIKLGQAVSSLRYEDVLILAGGLTIHNFGKFNEWDESSSSEDVKAFESEIIRASLKDDKDEMLKSLKDLTKLKGFRIACPREEHFAPIWIAAGAGSDKGKTEILCDFHGAKTIAYGVV